VIRVAIVDDEAPARAKLRGLLTHETDVEIVGEAADGVESVELIVREQPDLVFLDIQMPRLSGFGVIEEIGAEHMPAVIFVTAYDQHAVKAFEVHAVDYLLKPFAPTRLGRALDGYRRRPARGTTSRLGKLLADQPASATALSRVLVHSGPNRQILLTMTDVDVIRAHGNDVEIVVGRAAYRRRGTLSAMESRLDPEVFLRINRSEIVRIDAVAEIQPWFHGDAKMILSNGEILSWSRRYRARDRNRFSLGP
jgi:two-component system LytT family response regulator